MNETGKKLLNERAVRLPSYFSFIRIVGLVSVFVVWFTSLLLPVEYLSFFDDPKLVLRVMFGFLVIAMVFFYLYQKTRMVFVEYVMGSFWASFYIFILWQSGGVLSVFLILLVFPIFAAATNLSSNQIRFYGIYSVFGYGILLLFQSEYWNSPQVITQYILQIVFLSIVNLYTYRLVKEILKQKYEKQEAAKKYFQLVEVDQMKSDFIMVVSHQLRSPLTGARYALELLRDTKDDKTRGYLTAQVAERVSLSLDTVNEMLKSIELGSGSMRSSWESVPLGTLLSEINEDLRYDREKGGTRVDMHINGNFPVLGDRNLLKVACANVIENAIRYAPKGEVSISAVSNFNRIRVTVTDTGVGISTNDQPHIFDRFFRAKNSMHLYPNESGIGLFIAKQIIERHLGTIELVTSELGKGTTMEITLPLYNPSVNTLTVQESVVPSA